MQQIKAIFFDLGNVIVRFDATILEKEYAPYSKVDSSKFVDYILDSDNVNRYMEGKLTSSQFYSKTCRLFKMKIGFNEFYRIWNSIFYPYPEMEEIVKTIRKKYMGIKLILISNTNEMHYEFLKREYKILGLMDASIVSHKIGRQKPHPDIFTRALKAAGTKSKETFYTDDRPELIDAARVMGIRAFTFTDPGNLRKQLSKYEIHI